MSSFPNSSKTWARRAIWSYHNAMRSANLMSSKEWTESKRSSSGGPLCGLGTSSDLEECLWWLRNQALIWRNGSIYNSLRNRLISFRCSILAYVIRMIIFINWIKVQTQNIAMFVHLCLHPLKIIAAELEIQGMIQGTLALVLHLPPCLQPAVSQECTPQTTIYYKEGKCQIWAPIT